MGVRVCKDEYECRSNEVRAPGVGVWRCEDVWCEGVMVRGCEV